MQETSCQYFCNRSVCNVSVQELLPEVSWQDLCRVRWAKSQQLSVQCHSVEDLYWVFLWKLSGKFSWQNLRERLLGKIPATELSAMSRYKISKRAVLARSPYKISTRTSPCGYVTWETNSMKDPNHVLSPKRGREVWTETSILMQQVREIKIPGGGEKKSLAQSMVFVAGRSHFTRKNTRFPAPAFPQNEAHATSMQPLQWVLQHQVLNPHFSTHMATQNDNNHAPITLQSATRV